MTVMALYNLVDTIFVGRGVGTMAIGGLAVVMPMQMLIFATAQVFGMGGSSVISRALGAKEKDKANRTFGNLISLTLLLSILLLILGYLFARPILYLFGAQGTIFPYALDYFLVILAGTPFLSFAMAFNSIIRAEGNAKTAMMIMLVSAILNIILDPIFIFGMGWGVKGAAGATVISQISAFFYMLTYYMRGKSSLRFHFKNLKLDKTITREVFAIGASSLGRHGAGSILAAILNHILYIYGGELAISVYGVINRVFRVSFMPLFGLIQGFLPIAGFNYGARNFARVRETLKKTTVISTLTISGIYILLMLFSRQVMEVFSTDPALIKEGQFAVRAILLVTPVLGFQMVGAGYFQAVGKALPSFFLALARQIFFFLPLLLIVPHYYGLNGVWFSFPIADSLSAMVTLLMLLPEIKRLRTQV